MLCLNLSKLITSQLKFACLESTVRICSKLIIKTPEHRLIWIKTAQIIPTVIVILFSLLKEATSF